VPALEQIDGWGAHHASAGAATADRVLATHGDERHGFRWASVTKLLTASAVLVAAEEGIVELDEPAGPRGSTVRHLLAHASGLPFEGPEPIARPGERRTYSNTGYDELGGFVADRAGMPFADYLDAAILSPLGLTETRLDGSPASHAFGPLRDLIAFGRELLAPSFLAAETFAEATSVAFPGLTGVLPGFGRQEPSGGLGSSFATRSHRTGPGRRTRRARSAISVAQGRSSGSIPTLASPADASPTVSSTTGRSKRGRGCRMQSSRNFVSRRGRFDRPRGWRGRDRSGYMRGVSPIRPYGPTEPVRRRYVSTKSGRMTSSKVSRLQLATVAGVTA
jgi:hypothetical protein